MKVLMLTSSYPRYRGDFFGLFIHDLARELVRNGWNVTVVAPHEARLPRSEVRDGIVIRRFVYAWPRLLEGLSYGAGVLGNLRRRPYLFFLVVPYLFAMRRIAFRLQREHQFDLVHAHWWLPAGWVAQQLKKSCDRPFVLTSHGSDVFALLRSSGLRRLAESIFQSAGAITVNSTATRDALIKRIPGLAAVHVIPAPVNIERSVTAVENHIGVTRDAQQILFVGRLTAQKGVRYLLEALPAVLREYPNARLCVIGDGAERPRLDKLAANLGIKSNVSFEGSLPNDRVMQEMARADVVVLPSITGKSGEVEGLGVVLLEALASGKPVVATRTGGIPDVIRDSVTGLLVEPGDADALGKAICHLFGDPALAAHLAIAGREHVIRNFGATAVAQAMQEVYHQVLSGERTACA